MKWGEEDFSGGPVDKNPPANAGDRVQPLLWEDTASRGATKPAGHNYWGLCASCLCSAMKNHPCSPQLEKAQTQQQRPVQPKPNFF